LSRPTVRFLLLGVLAFAITLIALCPARWASSLLPAGVQCAAWSGSIWSGQCDGLRVNSAGSAPVADTLRWTLRPLALLTAHLSADVRVEQAALQAQGRVTAGRGGSLSIEGLEASGLLDKRLLAALPTGWSARFEVKAADIDYAGTQLRKLAGTFTARDLRDQRGTVLGDYQLQFPQQAAAPFNGQLRDLAGPLQLAATVKVDANRSWQLDGTALLRPGAPPVLARALDQLGTADLNGQRRISIAGTVD
jgi:hypothetical protein